MDALMGYYLDMQGRMDYQSGNPGGLRSSVPLSTSTGINRAMALTHTFLVMVLLQFSHRVILHQCTMVSSVRRVYPLAQ